MLKYQGVAVVLQEVPNEISLAINISNCPYHCPDCHSKFLWEDKGRPLTEDFSMLLEKYKGLVTCICFMGGDQEEEELRDLILKATYHGYKTCLYTGRDTPQGVLAEFPMACDLDYIKVGHYDDKLGGLDKRTTNQRMYQIYHSWGYPVAVDITEKFRRKYVIT